DRFRHLVARVRTETAAVLGHADASRIEPEMGFFDSGLDSLMALELRRRLREATGVHLPATVTFDHPSPLQVAAFLHDSLAASLGEQPPHASEDRSPPRAHAPNDQPVAIVGMALRLPRGVDNPDDFWKFLEQGRDAVGPIPDSRFRTASVYDLDPEAKGKS